MIRRLATAVGLLLALAPPAAGQFDANRIDSLVEARRVRHGIEGIALAVVHPMAILHERGFGTVRGGVPAMTAYTVFAIPAYSGPITGTLAMRLVDRGALALDAPITAYLPRFGSADTGATGRITPRLLLLHRSGLPAGPSPIGSRPPASLAEAVAAIANARLDTPPGEGFTYSESNYQLLAYLLEQVTGTPYPELVQAEIRDPLALPRPVSPEAPGTLTFSVDELGNFARAHLNLGGYEDRTLLSLESMVEMTSFDSGARYAAGWGWRTIPGRNAIGYSGVMEGSQTELVLLTSDGIGVVLLANATGAAQWRAMQRLAEDVALLAVGEEPRPGPAGTRWRWLVGAGILAALAAARVLSRRRRQVA